ncbi:hypothetical protein [Mycolicibacterium mengxianglii]|uniref:hypothetical protein n=1 Tax=Mycolicibacterium mengxianglii TaxID=2736649 RepID=UPI0018D19521|nr:hypothetical protein [Mycolicibacterium mengxianglii]
MHEIDDSRIQDMQVIPARLEANALKPVLALTDRMWFKFKSEDFRAAVTRLREFEVAEAVLGHPTLGRWWIGAFGYRQQDSAQRDFYATLEAEVVRRGKEISKPLSSDHLLPATWDNRRLEAELSVVVERVIRRTAIETIARSFRTGALVYGTVEGHIIGASVSAPVHDEAYLVLGAGGRYDQDVITVILNSVPGLSADDWMYEPAATLGIDEAGGEVVFSALLPAEAQTEILRIAADLES